MKVDEWGIPINTSSEIEEYKPPKENFNLFKVMYSALDKRFKPTEDEKKKISGYLFNNILANHESTIEFALMFTTHDNIPVNKQYDMVRHLLPICYIPYPKKNKNDQKDIGNIMNYYECSERIANQYYEMLSKEEINEINEKYCEGV